MMMIRNKNKNNVAFMRNKLGTYYVDDKKTGEIWLDFIKEPYGDVRRTQYKKPETTKLLKKT